MHIFQLVAVAAVTASVAIAGSASSVAQSTAARTPHERILGYQDQVTGTFHPLSIIAPDTTITPTTGTVELTLTITMKTALPKDGYITCSSAVDAESASTALPIGVSLWTEEAFKAAKVVGSEATCTVTIPYSWRLPTASSTLVNSYTGTYEVYMYGASGSPVRVSSGPFISGSIPTSGTTTTVALSGVI
jgi:hypothetical protein